MAISTDQKPTIYRNFNDNTAPDQRGRVDIQTGDGDPGCHPAPGRPLLVTRVTATHLPGRTPCPNEGSPLPGDVHTPGSDRLATPTPGSLSGPAGW